VQSLLAARFKLTTHRESVEGFITRMMFGDRRIEPEDAILDGQVSKLQRLEGNVARHR